MAMYRTTSKSSGLPCARSCTATLGSFLSTSSDSVCAIQVFVRSSVTVPLSSFLTKWLFSYSTPCSLMTGAMARSLLLAVSTRMAWTRSKTSSRAAHVARARASWSRPSASCIVALTASHLSTVSLWRSGLRIRSCIERSTLTISSMSSSHPLKPSWFCLSRVVMASISTTLPILASSSWPCDSPSIPVLISVSTDSTLE
mmetsp:Transcript_23312/g.58440  ORF Transcript_23312/g.58440 Transcript_23312/m.58440 type:complete len:200 (-) Transcript_23312:2018-2617(-)